MHAIVTVTKRTCHAIALFTWLCFAMLLAVANAAEPTVVITKPASAAADNLLTVYKSPTCGCCEKWVTHMEEAGFSAVSRHPDNLNALKQQLGIKPGMHSCHTAVSTDGYVFEGHIPARYVQAFLANPPVDAIGLSVPAMPVGSPGMEVGDRFMPYQVLLLKQDGGTEVYAAVATAAQQ